MHPWQHRKGSSTGRGYGYSWQQLRLRILQRDGYLCRCPRCQAKGWVREANEVDHIVPKAQGGTDEPSNLRAVNRACHERITLEQQGFKAPRVIAADGWPVDA
jgi:5-methylcytosine-specific restriction protein A